MLLLMPMGRNRVQGPHAGHTQAFGRPPGTSPAPTGRFERVSVHLKTPLYVLKAEMVFLWMRVHTCRVMIMGLIKGGVA